MQVPSTENATVCVYENEAQVEMAIGALQRSGFDFRKLSVASKYLEFGDGVFACHANRTGFHCSGMLQPLWGELWRLLSGGAFFWVPRIGPVLVAGPLAGWMLSAVDNAAIFSGLTPIGAGLYSIGISRARVAEYEAELRHNRYLVLAHGAAHEIGVAKQILTLPIQLP